MISYTVHTRPGARPVLVREQFSVFALIFGPLWLLRHRAWIAAVLAFCAEASLIAVPRGPAVIVLAFGLHWLFGLFGQDLRRWSLDRRGFAMAQVVVAADPDAALQRLLDRRPDLAREMAA